jgi:hypothetical protein
MEPEILQIMAYNYLGDVVYRESRSTINLSGIKRMNLSTLPEGLYILSISTPAGTLTRKFEIKRQGGD